MIIHRSIKCHTLHKRLRLVNLSSLYNDIFFKYVQNSPFTWQLWLILCNCFGEYFFFLSFSCYNNETRQVVLRFFSTLLNDFPQFGIKDHIDNKWNLHVSDSTMLPPKCEQHCQPCEVAQTMSRKKKLAWHSILSQWIGHGSGFSHRTLVLTTKYCIPRSGIA